MSLTPEQCLHVVGSHHVCVECTNLGWLWGSNEITREPVVYLLSKWHLLLSQGPGNSWASNQLGQSWGQRLLWLAPQEVRDQPSRSRLEACTFQSEESCQQSEKSPQIGRPRLLLLGFRGSKSTVPGTYPYSMIWRASSVICLLSSHGLTLHWVAWVHRVPAWGTRTHPQIRAVSP